MDENGKIDSKNYWILANGIVDLSSVNEDVGKEWDFENNKVK